ncbi:MAG: hypothetical protein K2F83_08210, partial [Oscillospiraceae bacterium]|nr:hypothetical protein [Oscillospiraceae bacterium]
TEYQHDMTRRTLGVDEESIPYTYHGRKVEKAWGEVAWVAIPDIETRVAMGGDADTAAVEEGIAFSPVYHIRLHKTMTKGEFTTWLRLQKEN